MSGEQSARERFALSLPTIGVEDHMSNTFTDALNRERDSRKSERDAERDRQARAAVLLRRFKDEVSEADHDIPKGPIEVEIIQRRCIVKVAEQVVLTWNAESDVCVTRRGDGTVVASTGNVEEMFAVTAAALWDHQESGGPKQ